MSERDDELELQALERRLDDAFATTRPRAGFEDELWSRMQSHRPFWSRAGEVLAGLAQGIREVPAVPLASVAVILVVLVGAGIFAYGGIGRLGGGGASTTSGRAQLSQGAGGGVTNSAHSFGRLPSPVFKPAGPNNPAVPNRSAATAAQPIVDYPGPVTTTWTGQLNLTITAAPVFRYTEPSTDVADQFASSLGAALTRRPAGYLGLYDASDYTLTVRGTIQSPPQEPAYFILAAPSMAGISAAGAQPADIAELFLAEHSLVPQWPYTTVVDGTSDQLKVHFLRQFDAPGYGLAHLVDAAGNSYGMEVDLNGTRPVLASGLLPVNLDSTDYPIISSQQAVRSALASASTGTAGASPAITVPLTSAALVYTLVPAGDHSFYEPAFLFSGTFQVKGVTYEKRVLVPAVDPTK
ncbi:MAG: hypothetical protein ACREOM_09210 [Candidatus Dormibacteraceae bacterium]